MKQLKGLYCQHTMCYSHGLLCIPESIKCNGTAKNETFFRCFVGHADPIRTNHSALHSSSKRLDLDKDISAFNNTPCFYNKIRLWPVFPHNEISEIVLLIRLLKI